jgi:hypothetical protein
LRESLPGVNFADRDPRRQKAQDGGAEHPRPGKILNLDKVQRFF